MIYSYFNHNKYYLFIILLYLSIDHSQQQSQSQHQTINVFLIPHSHCDVGWTQTYEQYYIGSVKQIIDNVVLSLLDDSTKKFNWAEVIYFERWWNEQTTETQSQVRQLIQNKQLEFVGGGWTQNDEAVTHYQAVLNQMTIGHQFLLNTFGVVPQVGWQIDPFGASTLTPLLFHLIGFKYHVIDRLDNRLKYIYNTSTPDIPDSGEMIETRSFEFNWYPSKNYNSSSSSGSNQPMIFTHVLDNHYDSPQQCVPNAVKPLYCSGFDFEGDKRENPVITSANIDQRAELLMEIIRDRASYYRHNNLLIPFGGDFRFQNAVVEFSNMDRLIDYINNSEESYINIRYATLSEYFEAVQAETEPSDFPTVNNTDFFAYTKCLDVDIRDAATCVNYWTGYYSSFPLLKQTTRMADTLIRHIETLYTLASATKESTQPTNSFTFDGESVYSAIQLHRNISGILTHHDAVTGTARYAVRNDYFNMLYDAQNTSLNAIPTMISYLLSNQSMETGFDFQDELLKGMSIGQVVVVSLSNSIAWDRVEYVHIPVGNQSYAVYDFNQQPITSQLVDRLDKGEWELYFEVSVPALGISTYFIMCIANSHEDYFESDYQFNYVRNIDDLLYPTPSFITRSHKIIPTESTDIVIGNSQFELHFQPNPINNNLMQLTYYQDLVGSSGNVTVKQYLAEYDSMLDDCYKFRTTGYAHPLNASDPQFYVKVGPIVSIVTIVYNINITQVFTVYNSSSNNNSIQTITNEDQYFEIESIVSANQNKEIVMRFNTSIQNDLVFYSNNGLELMERTWTEKFNDSHIWSLISGNFYPSINTGLITDGDTELVVLNQQSMGMSSQANGLLEFLLIRRSNFTQWSINEKMNDTSTVHIKSRVLVGQPTIKESERTPQSILHENELLKMFAPVKGDSIKIWCQQMKTQYSPMADRPFPQNLHLLTLNNQWNDTSRVLLRLVNIYEVGQSQIYSQPITIALPDIFTQLDITSVVDTTLTANSIISNSSSQQLSVTIHPIEIQTYTVSLNNKDYQYFGNFTKGTNKILIN